MRFQYLAITLLACLLVACTTGSSSSIPDRIVAERAGFIPEGIEYDTNNGRFLTGSPAHWPMAQSTRFPIGAA